MTGAATLILENAEVHTLTEPDEVYEAVVVRDGGIVRLCDGYEAAFLEGVETTVIDCDGRVVLPGFVDAHVHMELLGQYRVHADLSGAAGPQECVDRLRDQLAAGREWTVGFGYDESEWPDPHLLTREELDAVSTDRPVAAVRVDMHTASLNTAAIEELRGELAEDDVLIEDGEPTGVVVEDAAEAVWRAIEPDLEGCRELLVAAQDHATARGVTAVHDMVRDSHAPRAYRELEAAGELDLRVRLNYWSDHLGAVREAGLATNAGSELVRMGAIKSFTDGSIGARTAKLFEPYEGPDGSIDDEGPDGSIDGEGVDGSEVDDEGTTDGEGVDGSEVDDEGTTDGEGVDGSEGTDGSEEGDHDRGLWVVDPEELRETLEEAETAGYQFAAHAIGDEAIEAILTAYEGLEDPGEARHRIEHAELATDDQIRRLADSGVVASMQPNFLRWAEEGGLYDRQLGAERRRRADRFRTLLDSGVNLAFGSDCMPLDPLYGVHHAVNAPTAAQSLSVTEALRAYTLGPAYAGFDEDRLGTIESGKRADFAVLEDSPWERPDRIAEIDVALTVVDGEVVHDAR